MLATRPLKQRLLRSLPRRSPPKSPPRRSLPRPKQPLFWPWLILHLNVEQMMIVLVFGKYISYKKLITYYNTLSSCCNLFTNKCVLDPEGTICDIKPTTTVIKTTVKGTKTITTKVTTKNTTPATPTATTTPGLSGLTVQISSSADFCLFLPPSPGNKDANGGKVDKDAIADSEKNAVSFCTKPNINAPGAGIFPTGFIKKARYQTNTAAGFVQVRGTLDISAYDLSSKDDGGQYDNHGKGSPPKSACAGYPYYVSLIEPSSADFCIRW